MSKIISAVQGSPEWHKHRAEHFNASDASAMLGISRYKSRDALIAEKATGVTPEVDPATQARFDDGHRFEEMARPWAEEIVGDELFPVVLADTIDGLPLSASLDGQTMMGDVAFEHKTLNARLAESLEQGVIPEEYHPQMEQQLLVSGAERCLFMASAGDREGMRFAWYESNPAVRDRLIQGWKQFQKDVAAYQPKEKAVEIVGKAPMDLPALRIEITGGVTASNLGRFKEVALDVFASINTELKTDEDFANAEKTVKWCGTVEEKLAAAKQHALSQTATIDELFRTIDDLSEECRQVRLNLNRRVESRKKEVKLEIAKAAKEEFDKHIAMANKALGGDYMPHIPTDFNAAMKGKRTVATLESAANDELARARIEANRIASRIEENLELLGRLAGEHEFLFADKKSLVVDHEKTALEAIAKQRIAEHDQKLKDEAERLAEAARRDQERIEQARREQEAAQQEQAAPEPQSAPEPSEKRQPSLLQPEPRAAATKPQRPDDGDIIATVAQAYGVSEQTALGWLMEMNLRDVRLASNA